MPGSKIRYNIFMGEKIVRSRFVNKLLDMFLPALTWIIITIPLWLSPFHPAVVAYLIIAFDLYFLFKSVNTVYLAAISYQKIFITDKVDFLKKVLKIKNYDQIIHFVIIPNFKEPIYKIESTMQALVDNIYDKKKVVVILAFEEREKEALLKYNRLHKKYSHKFLDFLASYHPLREDEVPGKASNQTFAAKVLNQYINKKQYLPEKCLVTVCDADSRLPKNYFSYLTFTFLQDIDRNYHFYSAPVLLYNNFWKLPFSVRMQATISSIVRLAFLGYKDNLIQISTYSTNFWLLKQINFWDVDIIPEDWHVYLQAFFTFGKKIKTIPLYTIINSDAVFSGGLVKTLINRYEQEKRWAWGVSDISYSLRKFLTNMGEDFLPKIKKIFFLIETHLLWPSSFFILTLSASIPPLVNPVFKRTVLGFILPKLSGFILTTSSSMLFLYIYLDIKLRQKVNVKTKFQSLPMLIIQWYFLPIISFFFSSLPALEAHTRLLFGKKIKYKVTEKV